MKKVYVIPRVIHVLGVVSKGLQKHMYRSGLNTRFEVIQASILLGTAYMIRKNLLL